MASITPDDIIQIALQSNQGLINKSDLKVRELINQRLSRPEMQRQTPAVTPDDAPEAGHGDSPYSTNNEYGLEPGLYQAIQRLNEMSPFGPNTVRIGSGYRSYEEQARLYERWRAGVPGQARAAPPGRSNHNRGEAADLEYLSPQAREWVHSVAPDLGLHFPVPGENWHVERIR